jgi:hypothetical protein
VDDPRASEPSGFDPAVGLCSVCRHARVHENRRGSAFWQCARAAWDARLRRYPPLPVASCPGHEREPVAQGEG